MSLTASKKIVYMRHRRFLSKGHRYRQKKMDKYFDNNVELQSTAPLGNSKGKRVFNIVSKLKFIFGKKTKDGKQRKDVKPTPGATLKKVYFLRVFVILARVRRPPRDRWYARSEEYV
jgi:Fe-S cluster biosynthesis and repair protein YggX